MGDLRPAEPVEGHYGVSLRGKAVFGTAILAVLGLSVLGFYCTPQQTKATQTANQRMETRDDLRLMYEAVAKRQPQRGGRGGYPTLLPSFTLDPTTLTEGEARGTLGMVSEAVAKRQIQEGGHRG